MKKGQVEKLRIRKLPNKNLYKVYGETGRPLSEQGLSKKMAEKQATAVRLSELRQMGRIPERKPMKVKKM